MHLVRYALSLMKLQKYKITILFLRSPLPALPARFISRLKFFDPPVVFSRAFVGLVIVRVLTPASFSDTSKCDLEHRFNGFCIRYPVG